MSVFLIGDFDDQMDRDLLPALTDVIHKKAANRGGEITLYINSHGGFVHLAWHIVGLIEIAKNHGITVRTVVTGVAYSSASIVAVSGTVGERYISSRSEHLVHYGQAESTNRTPSQVYRNYAEHLRGFDLIKNHYLSNTGIDSETLEIILDDDAGYVTAKAALLYGFADKTMTELKLGVDR